VQRHITEVRRYLESEAPILANALVLAFDGRVRFTAADQSPRRPTVGYSIPGELVIPLGEQDKPAWLVDGQQRAAAIRDAAITSFPVPVVGFITGDQAEQRTQFVLVNNTKPLPKGLVHELLPDTSGPLPRAFARKQLPATIMTALNTVPGGPFCGAIASPTARDGYIKDNSVLRMIENSLYEGALYQYRNPADGTGDIEAILAHLSAYWSAVRDTFPEAWRLPPRRSRLTHGVGIQAMGFVMDDLTGEVDAARVAAQVAAPLARLGAEAAWTSGTWLLSNGQERPWHGLQNTSTDLRLLTATLRGFIASTRASSDGRP
jgi:DGQHR domain-containing protein